jgi:DNA-3-methyladenine glycosylase II
MTDGVGRYERSEAFLRNLDGDWARLIDLVGPCLHDPKAARDAIIARFKALFAGAAFPTPANLVEADFDSPRACGFSANKIATIKAIAAGSLSGLIPSHAEASSMDNETLIAGIATTKGIGRWTVEMLFMYSHERMTSCLWTISEFVRVIAP